MARSIRVTTTRFPAGPVGVIASMAVVGLVALAVLAAPEAKAELAAWDQKQVTAIAGELSEAARALEVALRQVAPETRNVAGRRAFWNLRDQVSATVAASARLQRLLAAGEGLDETYPTYRRILNLARRAQREIRRISLKEPVTTRIDEVAAALRRIRPFYESEPPI